MANKRFKILSATASLLIYLWVAVMGNALLQLCDCHCHHHSVHSCRALVGDSHCGCESCGYDTTNSQYESGECSCSHGYTSEVELYTFSRNDNSDSSVRYLPMPMAVAECGCGICTVVASDRVEYGLYLGPPLSAVEKGSAALRAPPVLV